MEAGKSVEGAEEMDEASFDDFLDDCLPNSTSRP